MAQADTWVELDGVEMSLLIPAIRRLSASMFDIFSALDGRYPGDRVVMSLLIPAIRRLDV